MKKRDSLSSICMAAYSFINASLIATSVIILSTVFSCSPVNAAPRAHLQTAKLSSPANWLEQLKELGVRNDPDSDDYYELPETKDMRTDERRLLSSGGKNYLVEVYTFHCDSDWGGMTVLALFDRGKLIDAVNVQEDRECWLYSYTPVLAMPGGENCLVVDNTHLNAGENYTALTLYGLRKGKLKAVGKNLPLVYSMRRADLYVSRDAHFVRSRDRDGKQRLYFEIKQVESHIDQDSDKVLSTRSKTMRMQVCPVAGEYKISSRDPGLKLFDREDKRLGINQE